MTFYRDYCANSVSNKMNESVLQLAKALATNGLGEDPNDKMGTAKKTHVSKASEKFDKFR